MFSLSQTTGYAILALGCLDEAAKGWVKANEIASTSGIPLPYLSKILHRLGQAELVTAKRGTFGGYALAKPDEEVSVAEITVAIEGEDWLPRCLLGWNACSEDRPCPTSQFWNVERERIRGMLERTKLSQISEYLHDHPDLKPGAFCSSAAAGEVPDQARAHCMRGGGTATPRHRSTRTAVARNTL